MKEYMLECASVFCCDDCREILKKYDLSKYKTCVKKAKRYFDAEEEDCLFIELDDVAEFSRDLGVCVIVEPKKYFWNDDPYKRPYEIITIYDSYIE